MKFKILPALSFILLNSFFQNASAQDDSRRFNIGLLAGANVSSFTERVGEFGTNKNYDEHIRISPALGLHARYQLTKIVSLRTELLFNSRGGAYRVESSVISIGGNGDKNYYNKNYRLNYFEIPFLAEIDFMGSAAPSRLHVRFAAGASYGLPVSSTLRYNGYAPTGSTSGPLVDVKESYDVVKIGHANSPILNSIAELSFDFVNGHDTPLFVRIRYNGSLKKVYNQDEIGGYNFNTKMTTWALTFGFYFMKH
jgi:hypothetical protein